MITPDEIRAKQDANLPPEETWNRSFLKFLVYDYMARSSSG